MKKITVIYWSGTGNTQKMADAVAQGVAETGVDVKVLPVDKASKDDVLNADAVAFGCPAMGDEVLEETEMEPFIKALEGEDLSTIPLVLFGSYDWGDGQWMREWVARMNAQGAKLVEEGLITQNTPDKSILVKCREIGVKLASATV
ncbi:flavodoxin [Sporomusa sp. KB1]|uniref:flavodoxin n=1 Tax=Sporomusa sp. KB1 TaxID=943346 RepID=UPI00119F1604|nr:flavodoxin [Sporomusa sp. KB1]TWH47620.1 flavodoxin short chain [Sporomusa sp. KB1]